MGSEIVFELWKKTNDYHIRVLWNGQPLKTSTPMGTIDMISLEQFNGYLDETLPKDPLEACAV